MTPRLRSPFLGLRIYGPCTCAELARKINRHPERVYRQLYELRQKNLVDCVPGGYDLTDYGKRVADQGFSQKKLVFPAERQT